MRPPDNIAYDVRQAMTQRELTQCQLASAIRVDQSQISRFRKGHFTCDSPNLLKVCEHLGIRVQEEVDALPPLRVQESELVKNILNRIMGTSGAKKRALFRLLRALNDLLD